ncbi:MAG: 4Fe-4S binding protein [Actinobacteria bacterium]|nr:4Fe-4S binding protein [Actinomycetota bacterium]
MTSPNGNAPARPLVLLCECAGTLKNLDFDRLEAHVGSHADVLRGDHWCSRVGQAQMRELMEAGAEGGRQLVFAGCSPDFAARRFQKLMARGLQLEIADIREGCSWVHGGDVAAVTDKAARIIDSSIAYPDALADTMSYAERRNTVVVIGGGVAGTQSAAELAQMGHHVELVERRAFLGGRAARIGTVFPTNDCGQCLPTTDAQAGTRKCFHRNVAIDHPDLAIHRRSTVEAVTGHPGDFQVSIRTLPNMVTDACVNCGTCETVCEADSSEPGKKAIFSEFYDGRVIRTIDLETCTFCGKCAEECPVEAIDFSQSPRRTTVHAGAILTATGCEPAPEKYFDYLGYGHNGVVTQVDLAEMLDDWAAQASLGRMPVEELVMVQCAGSRDQRHLPHCSRLCCMIALKHAIRLKTLFPEMKVTTVRRRRPARDRGRRRDGGAQARTAPRSRRAEHGYGARHRYGEADTDAHHRPRQGRLRRDPRPQEPRHRDQRRGHLRLRLGGRPQGSHRGQYRGLGGGQRDP